MALPFPLPPLHLDFGTGPSGPAGNNSDYSLGAGDWNVNMSGSGGGSMQLPTGGLPLLLLLAAGAWLLLKR